MRTKATVLAIAALCFAAACGGSDSGNVTNPNPNSNLNGKSMSARIDGATWTASAISVGVSNGALIIAGGSGTGAGIGIGASRLQGTGTQTFGSNTAALGTLTVGTQSWAANGVQGTGSVTLTTLTANRAVGTFVFTAPALSAGATPSPRQVTAGQFDVTF